jgi:hypothetical protein
MAYLQSSRFIAPHRFVSGYIRTGLPQGWHYHGSGKLPKKRDLWDPGLESTADTRACELTGGFWPRHRRRRPGIVVRANQESSSPTLPEHLVGLEEQGWGNSQAERLGGLEVDDQLEGRRLLHGQVGRLRPL